MANYVSRPMTEVPDYLVGTVIVPTGTTLYAGNIVFADVADTTISGNYSVFSAATPVTGTLGKQMAIVINGGWEQLPDGRRPEGNPDYTQYTYNAGEIATIVFLTPKMRFEISYDCITGTPTAGGVLYPVNASNVLTYNASTVPSGTFSSFNVTALKNFRLGGKFGAQFASTVVAMVKNPTA